MTSLFRDHLLRIASKNSEIKEDIRKLVTSSENRQTLFDLKSQLTLQRRWDLFGKKSFQTFVSRKSFSIIYELESSLEDVITPSIVRKILELRGIIRKFRNSSGFSPDSDFGSFFSSLEELADKAVTFSAMSGDVTNTVFYLDLIFSMAIEL